MYTFMFKNNYGAYEQYYDNFGNKKYFSTLEDLKNYLHEDLTITFVNNFMSRENGFFKIKILKGDIVIETLEVIK